MVVTMLVEEIRGLMDMEVQIVAEAGTIIMMIGLGVDTTVAFEVGEGEMAGVGGMIVIAITETEIGVPLREGAEVDPEVLTIPEALVDMELGET